MLTLYAAPALHKLGHITDTLDELRRQSLYRTIREGRVEGPHIVIDNQRMVNLGSNDYLGMGGTLPDGPTSSSSRLISGSDHAHYTLEEMLAAHHSTEAALTYPSGYMAVLGIIPVLAVQGCTILSDERNHASIIDACRLAGGHTKIFRHNDTSHLDSLLVDTDGDAIIVTEGIFSMDGDYADLQNIADVASRRGASIILDDAHGDFVVGPGGKGTASQLGVSDVYATVSSLSKALGSFGGYVASDDMVEAIQINRARSFVYTSALPPVLALDAVRRMRLDMETQRRRLQRNTRRIREGLQDMGLEPKSDTHIIPIMVGGEADAVKFADILYKNGVYAPAIRYPTIPRNEARVRISVTASLNDDSIDTVLYAFEEARKVLA